MTKSFCNRTYVFIAVFVFYSLFMLLIQLFFYSQNLHLSLNSWLRLMIPFFLFVSLGSLFRFYEAKIRYALYLSLGTLIFLAIFSILLGAFSGMGAEIGGRGTDIAGNKGFFIGANEVGILLLILLIFVNRMRSDYIRIFLLLAICVCGVIVLTKSSLVASCFAAVFIVNRYVYVKFFLMLGFTLLFSFYWSTIFEQAIIFTTGTFFDLNQGIVQFLFRGRQVYMNAFFSGIDFDSYFNLIRLFFFGFGENFVADVIAKGIDIPVGRRSTFEADFLDLFFSYGLCFFILYISLVYVFVKNFFSSLYFLEKTVVSLILIHSVMAGHVIYSPLVTITIVLMYFYLSKNQKTTYDKI